VSQAQEPGWEGRKNEWLAAASGFSSYLCRGNLHRCVPKILAFSQCSRNEKNNGEEQTD